MILAGHYYTLKINRQSPHGFYLGNGDEEVLLPNRFVTSEHKIGSQLQVFVYTDSEDRLVATTETPKAIVDQFAVLELKEMTPFGAFFDWGLSKDLLMPKAEIPFALKKGNFYPLFVLHDPQSNRVVASGRVDDFLVKANDHIKEGESYDGIVYHISDLGYKVIIDEKYSGLLYQNEVFQDLSLGQRIKVKVHQIREDGKIDLKIAVDRDKVQESIMNRLKTNDGFLPLHDKSAPEHIYDEFGISKKQFKAAIGGLYKNKEIIIKSDGVYLIGG